MTADVVIVKMSSVHPGNLYCHVSLSTEMVLRIEKVCNTYMGMLLRMQA